MQARETSETSEQICTLDNITPGLIEWKGDYFFTGKLVREPPHFTPPHSSMGFGLQKTSWLIESSWKGYSAGMSFMVWFPGGESSEFAIVGAQSTMAT